MLFDLVFEKIILISSWVRLYHPLLFTDKYYPFLSAVDLLLKIIIGVRAFAPLVEI